MGRFFNILVANILFFLHIASVNGEISTAYLYKPYQRDMVFLIDWYYETLAKTFNHQSEESFDSLVDGVTTALCANLANPASPMVLSASVWKNLVDHVQFAYDLNNLSEQAVLEKYQINAPAVLKTGLLSNTAFLLRLQKIIKKLLATYDEVNHELNIVAVLGIKDPVARVANLSKFKSQMLENTFSDSADRVLWKKCQSLLIYIWAYEKAKAGAHWVMKKINDDIYLFIPKAYLEGVEQATNQFMVSKGEGVNLLANSLIDAKTHRQLTVQEILLGLKYAPYADLQQPYVSSLDKLTSPVNSRALSENFVTILKDLFLNSKDFETYSHDIATWNPRYCRWNVYGVGHGSISQIGERHYSVMGLSEIAFKQLLTFLNSIATSFFFYESCFSGGQRLETLYVTTKKAKYKFTIAVGAFTDAPTAAYFTSPFLPPLRIQGIYDPITRKLAPILPRFDQFFSGLHMGASFKMKKQKKRYKPKPTYKEIINTVHRFYTPATNTLIDLANVPQIRFPGMAWFNVVDLESLGLRITPTYLATRRAERRPIKSYVRIKRKKNKYISVAYRIFLIDAFPIWELLSMHIQKSAIKDVVAQIDVPIIINSAMPTIVTTAASNALVYFSEVQATPIDFTDLLKNFFGVVKSPWARTYYIKKLTVHNSFDAEERALLGANTNTLVFDNVVILVNSPILGQNKKLYGFMGTFNNQSFQLLIEPEKLKDWLNPTPTKKDPVPIKITRATYVIPVFPYLTKEQALRLTSEKKALIEKDTANLEQLKQFKPWINSLELPEDRDFFENYIDPSKFKKIDQNISTTSNQQFAIVITAIIDDPQTLADFQQSQPPKEASFIENFVKLYNTHKEFSAWRNTLTKEQLDFIAAYRATEKTSYAPVVALLRKSKLLLEQYHKVATDQKELEKWLAGLSQGNKKYIELIMQRIKPPSLIELVVNLDQSLRELAIRMK